MKTPRIEFDLVKIGHNVRTLKKLYESKGINLVGVTKVICGNPSISRILQKNGIRYLADSQIQNIKRMRKAGIKSTFVLLRSPSMSQVVDVVKYVDISHNTEYCVIEKLSKVALKQKTKHKVILMIELGDLREGIMPDDIFEFTDRVLKLKGVKLVGIGTNLACFGGIEPDEHNMNELSSIASEIEARFKFKIKFVSGGSSANYNWSVTNENNTRINLLRIGEAIFLGRESLNRDTIPDLKTDAFTLIAEVIESKTKPSLPYGNISQDSFGEVQKFKDEGLMERIILGIGRQDVMVGGLTPRKDIDILGASSDHLIVNKKKLKIGVGEELLFDLNYSALLMAMNSKYVRKNKVN